MDVINVRKFGLAVGLTFAILRLGCIIVFGSSDFLVGKNQRLPDAISSLKT